MDVASPASITASSTSGICENHRYEAVSPHLPSSMSITDNKAERDYASTSFSLTQHQLMYIT